MNAFARRNAALLIGATILMFSGPALGAVIEKLNGERVRGEILKETSENITIEITIGRNGRAVMNIPVKNIHAITPCSGPPSPICNLPPTMGLTATERLTSRPT